MQNVIENIDCIGSTTQWNSIAGNGGTLTTIRGEKLKFMTGRSWARLDQISFGFAQCGSGQQIQVQHLGK